MKRLVIVTIPIVLLAGALLATAMEIEPHMTGAERVFTIKWEAGSRTNHSIVQGRIENVSPYPIRDVRLLVDALDGRGNVSWQRVAYIPGDFLGFGSASFFEVQVPAALGYRVRIYSYTRIRPD